MNRVKLIELKMMVKIWKEILLFKRKQYNNFNSILDNNLKFKIKINHKCIKLNNKIKEIIRYNIIKIKLNLIPKIAILKIIQKI
jgi:hypothetical protein